MCLTFHLLSAACTCCRNNENLGRLSCKIVSPLVFAHVRAAYPGMPVSEQNCHPFQWGRYMWMHNGVVGGFMRIRRALLASLSDAAYDTVQVRAGLLLCTGSRAAAAGIAGTVLRGGDCCSRC